LNCEDTNQIKRKDEKSGNWYSLIGIIPYAALKIEPQGSCLRNLVLVKPPPVLQVYRSGDFKTEERG